MTELIVLNIDNNINDINIGNIFKKGGGLHGHPRPSRGLHGHPRPSRGLHGHPRPSRGLHGHPRPSRGVPEESENYNISFGQEEPHTYGKIINTLIKGQTLRHLHPMADLYCDIGPGILKNIPQARRLLSNVYDHIIDTQSETSSKNSKNINDKHYEKIIKISASDVGENDSQFDTDYEYYTLKKILGPIISNNFMFKEKDIEIKQRGGFNFEKKKIKYPKKTFDPRLTSVCKLYNVNCDLIKHYHLKYFYLYKNTQYRPFNLSTMLDDIKEYDYITPLIKLSEYYSPDNYYEKLYQRNKKTLEKISLDNNKYRLDKMDELSIDDKESIISEYVKCRLSSFVITLWQSSIVNINNFVDILNENGNVYYVKTMNVNKNILRNLMFWMYDEFKFQNRIDAIEKKLEYINASNDNEICFIIFDNVKNKSLSGKGSHFKTELRNKLLEFISEDDKRKYLTNKDTTPEYMGFDLLHINDYFYQTIEYTQLIFNTNSLNVIRNQNCKMFADEGFALANLKFQTLRNILYSDLSLLEMNRFIIMGGGVLYAYSVRAFKDIDAALIDIEPNSSQKLINYVENFFVHKQSKIYFLDAGIQGSKQWEKAWTDKNAIINNFLGIKDLKDLVLDPKNYFYHQGVKMVILDFEMTKKIMRNRVEDHVDFLMMNILYPNIINKYVTLTPIYQSDLNKNIYPDTDPDTNLDTDPDTNPDTNPDTDPDTNPDTDNDFFIINKKYSSIKGRYNKDFVIKDTKMSVLERRYTKKQIDTAMKTKLLTDFLK
jgi:hypothetical protein